MKQISNLPPKGTADWLPEEYSIRKYIFDTWRKVCLSFGYQEYLTPIIESADVYRAKSGEDVGGKELMTMVDRGGRELAIRPEMTPSVTRMVSRIYDNSPKPLRLFSIANFLRNEKPQKGRNREFWQLNADIFGSDSINSDIEVATLAIEIMKAFGANASQFVLAFNDRKAIIDLIRSYLKVEESNVGIAVRILDKFWKLETSDFIKRLVDEAGAVVDNPDQFIGFVKGEEKYRKEVLDLFLDKPEWKAIKLFAQKLEDLSYNEFVMFDPSMVRGLDYYDGIVFEVFDKRLYDRRRGLNVSEPSVDRSLFGGGRYNGLAAIFGSKSFPAVGFAPGDETMKLFLESWNLMPNNLEAEVYYLPVLSETLAQKIVAIVSRLRSEGKVVIQGLEQQDLSKALASGNKMKVAYVVIYGEDEERRGIYLIKDMKSGAQKELDL